MTLKEILSMKNPDAVYEQLLKTNPQFRKFVEDNKGKSAEQILKENNMNPGILNLLK